MSNTNNIQMKWLALWCSYLLFVATAITLFQFTPLINLINADIPLSDVDIGLIQGFYALPAVLLALPGGFAVDKIDSRRAGIISGALLLAGNIIFTLGGSVIWMLAGRLLTGIASILINLISARMITLWFPREQRGFSMSIFHTAWPVTAGLSYSLFVDWGQSLGWQTMLWLVNGFVLAVLILFIIAAPRDPNGQEQPENNRLNPFIAIRSLPADLWKTGMAWFLFTGGMMGLLTFGAKHLEALGFAYKTGNLWVGFLMIMAIPGSLIAGRIIDRFASLRHYMILPPVLVALCFLGFTFGLVPWLMMLIAGLMATFMPIAVYAMPGELVGPRRIGLAFGLILTFSNIGNTLGPIILGWINQLSGNYAFGMATVTGMMAVIAVCGAMLASMDAGKQKEH